MVGTARCQGRSVATRTRVSRATGTACSVTAVAFAIAGADEVTPRDTASAVLSGAHTARTTAASVVIAAAATTSACKAPTATADTAATATANAPAAPRSTHESAGVS